MAYTLYDKFAGWAATPTAAPQRPAWTVTPPAAEVLIAALVEASAGKTSTGPTTPNRPTGSPAATTGRNAEEVPYD